MKKFFNEDNARMNYKDYITLMFIIIIYGIFSFYRLGSFNNPNTFQNFQAMNSVIIKFDKLEDIIKMKVFNGDKNAVYQIYTSLDNKKYKFVTSVVGEGSFAWDDLRIVSKGKYLKLLFLEDSSLGEISFYDNNKKRINIKDIKYKDKKINTLTDEKDVIPKQISYFNSSYFDEIYFARTAYEYTKNLETYEWVHPPLGKLIQAIPIFVTQKMTPFNYRLMGNISGILMIIVMYYFGKLLFKERKYAIFSALLISLDTFHFAQTRIGTVDSHLVLFILCSLYFMCKFIKNKNNVDLFLSGLFFSLSISVKWTGFYGGLALAIIYFIYHIKDKKINFDFFIKGMLFFVFLPLTIYFGLYLMFPNNRINYTNNIENVIKQQQDIYNYHSKLESDHYFSSKWYTWPLGYKPVWYHNQVIDANRRETISAIGNIVIWWMGIISFLYLIIKFLLKKDRKAFFLIVVILSLFLPYSFINRQMFLYHYFPVLPFLILSIVLMFKDIVNKFKLNIIIPIYLITVFIFFLIYYPIISGMIVDNIYIDNLKIFSSWYF